MANNKDKIQVTYEIINGKKVRIEKIPTGMSGKVDTKSSYYDEDDDDEYPSSTSSRNLYDEENTYLSTDNFLDM
jgi:hypothetical protein